jgi:hypothetical protein
MEYFLCLKLSVLLVFSERLPKTSIGNEGATFTESDGMC